MTRPWLPEGTVPEASRRRLLAHGARTAPLAFWRVELVDQRRQRMRDELLVRFATGSPRWVRLTPPEFRGFRRELGLWGEASPVRLTPHSAPPAEPSSFLLRRWPMPSPLNAFLVLLVFVLGAALRMAFFQGEPEPLLAVAVGLPVLALLGIAARRIAPWRIRLVCADGRLKVFTGRRERLVHDLALADLHSLWLQEEHPVEQKVPYRHATRHALFLMAATRQHPALDLLCLRDGHLWAPRLQLLLAWLEDHAVRRG